MTVQACEKIIYEGDKRDMHTTPIIPKDQYIVNHLGMGLPNSNCWRGYIGTWEVRDNALYLLSLKGGYSMKSNQPVFASWYTGDLVLPEGKPIKYFRGKFGILYEKEIIIYIICGHVVEKKYCHYDADSMHKKPQKKEKRFLRIFRGFF